MKRADKKISYTLLTLLMASCSKIGYVPNNGGSAPPLSGDLTGTAGSAVVNSVGGVAAGNIASGVLAANKATDGNTSATLVKRDASGGFSAGTITANLNGTAANAANAASAAFATFALGKQGGNIFSQATLSPGSDGNFFDVTGSGSISGISALPAGTRLSFKFAGISTLIHDPAKLTLSGSGNFTTSPNDLFEFLSLGSGNWKEYSRSVTGDSRVAMNLIGSQTISGTLSTILFNSRVSDSQNEYNPSSGMFTARQAGSYLVSASVLLQGSGLPAGTIVGITIVQTGSATIPNTVIVAAPGGGGSVLFSAFNSSVFQLASGDTLSISVGTGGGPSLTGGAGSPSNTSLNIIRLH